MDEHYFFGCIHKNSEIDILTEIKSKTKEDSIDLDELIFEHITYFYIDYEHLYLSIIKTQRIQNSYLYIENLLGKYTGINLSVLPLKKNENEIENMLATALNITFINTEKDFVILDLLNKDDCKISKCKLDIKFEKTPPSLVKQIISKYKKSEKVKKLSISTVTEDIDILSNTFTKQVAINLSKDFKHDLNSIKDSLRNELLKIIDA